MFFSPVYLIFAAYNKILKLIEWNDCKELLAEDINDSIYAYIGGDPSTGIQVSKMMRTDNISRTNPAVIS